MRHAAKAYAAFGAGLIATHFAVGGSVLVYEAIGASSAAAVLVGAAVRRPLNRLGWFGIGVAQLIFFAGDVVYQSQAAPPFPGPADLLYLTSYAIFIPSVFALVRPFPWRDLSGHLETLLIGICIGVALWMVALDGMFDVTWSAANVVSISYPVADMVALAALLRVGLLGGRRPAAYWLLLFSLLPLLVADGSYVIPALSAQYHLGSWLDIGWLGAYVLVGTAALHPSMACLATRDADLTTPPLRRILLGGASLLLLPGAELYEELVRHRSDATLLAVAGLVVLAAMVGRAALLVNELDRQRRLAQDSGRRFRMVFERAPVGISLGAGGIMTETNPAFQRMLGYTGDELARMHYTDVTHPDEHDLSVQSDLNEGRRSHFASEKRYVAKDGHEVPTYVHVVRDPSDGFGMSLVEDITQRRELEAQLRQAQKMDAIGKLAGGIAHDFNNLMTAVLGYSDLVLAKVEPTDPNRERVASIRDAAERASDLTRQLLAFGRRQMLDVREVDLAHVVGRSESLLQRLIGEDIVLATRLGPEPVVVYADASQLDQVVINLAVNARDAMPNGGLLTIGVEADGPDAVLTVADSGVGMDEDTRARIFEPFFTTKEFGEGTGLGLSTVDGIVAQSGGVIAVESRAGRGTTFTVRLPLAIPAEIHTERTPLAHPV